MSTPDLKPCPFCGATSVSFSEGSTFRWLLLNCDECGASPGEVRVQTLGDGTRDDWRKQGEANAIAAWNRRSALTDQGAGEPQCPKCGYTYLDCITHGDHHLCGEPTPPGIDEPAAWMFADQFGTHLSVDEPAAYPERAPLFRRPSIQCAREADPIAWIGPYAGMPPKDVTVLMQRTGSEQIPKWRWAHLRPLASVWRPIESAPKDGTEILLCRRSTKQKQFWVTDGYWSNTYWVWTYLKLEPTHWMPLPAIPEKADEV